VAKWSLINVIFLINFSGIIFIIWVISGGDNILQVSEGNDNIQVVLTKPLSVDGDVAADYKAPNLVQRMLSLIRNIRPGSDLTHFQASQVFSHFLLL
jgi:hypothetical protein